MHFLQELALEILEQLLVALLVEPLVPLMPLMPLVLRLVALILLLAALENCSSMFSRSASGLDLSWRLWPK